MAKKHFIKKGNLFVEPDEIFLDSKNLENFDRQQFEGRIEKPISKKTIWSIGIFFFVCIFIFVARLEFLQIQKGDLYKKRSEQNVLEEHLILSERGIIYDRNKVELAWNRKNSGTLSELPLREYLPYGFSHTVGYVNYPKKDKTGRYWRDEYTGKDGLEKEYDTLLKGKNGSKIVEVDAKGNIHSENITALPERGKDVITTLDSRIQKKLYGAIKNLSENAGYVGGAGVIMDIKNGEIISSVSFPEYDSFTLSLGEDKTKIASYIGDKRNLFLDRTLSGLYTPGSIVKPFFALGALEEGIISPNKKILSTGSISIPNPYFKDQPTIFRDWKAHGWTDMQEAIAVSSDVYFYAISGGFEDQKGLGISNLEKYARLFGIGEKTGVDLPDEKGGIIPSPEWKIKRFNGEVWRIGDTYNTAIGQYGFQVTPLEMARATAMLANGGYALTPRYVSTNKQEETIKKISVKDENLKIVKEGMRLGATAGTSAILNIPYVKIASKTGTAQVGIRKDKINSWVIGFFPYENPKYSFAIMMEAGPSSGVSGAMIAMRELLDYMNISTSEYFQ